MGAKIKLWNGMTKCQSDSKHIFADFGLALGFFNVLDGGAVQKQGLGIFVTQSSRYILGGYPISPKVVPVLRFWPYLAPIYQM
jgi:hypothetical protein